MKNLKKLLSAILCMILAVSCLALTSCDMLDQLTGMLGGNSGGSTNNGGLTEDDWFDDDIFDDETDDDFNDDTNDDTNDDDDDDDDQVTMEGPGAVRFEAEYAEWKHAADQAEFRIEAPGHASNGQCVAYFRTGGQLIFKIYSDKAENDVKITVSAASAVELWENGQQAGIKPVTAEQLAGSIVCNDVASTDIEGEFAGSDNSNGMQWHNFTTISATVDLVEGWNTVVFTCTATNGDNFSGLNVDYVELTTTDAKLGWWPVF
jgi:hypothetical protein